MSLTLIEHYTMIIPNQNPANYVSDTYLLMSLSISVILTINYFKKREVL